MSEERAELWAAGDYGYYVLPRSPVNGRQRPRYLPVVVVKVTQHRVVVRHRDGRGGHRVLLAASLVKAAPEGAWVK